MRVLDPSDDRPSTTDRHGSVCSSSPTTPPRTLAQTLDRLPASFAASVDHVLVCDDASPDDTYEVGLRSRSARDLPLTVVAHPENLGYGGNQKAGYHWAIDHGLDVVVLLHGDGQYAPEMIEPLVDAARSAARPTPCSAPG